MQKLIVAALALFAVVSAAPQQQQQQDQHNGVYIVSQDSNVSPDGYQFGYETSDGTSRHEQGTLKQVSEDHQALTVEGSYRYTAPDGQVYAVTFTADENGFKPQEHIEQQ